jgi:hypothetical protein
MEITLQIVEQDMMLAEHTMVQYTKYRESAGKLIKLMDLIDIFTTVN